MHTRTIFFPLLLSLFFFAGCGNGEQDQTQADPPTSIADVDVPDAPPLPDGEQAAEITFDASFDWNAVVMGRGVRSRDQAGTDGRVIRAFEMGEFVKIIGQNDKREILTEGDQCDAYGYHWYEVEDKMGVRNWIYGKFLYKVADLQRNSDRTIEGMKVEDRDGQLTFGTATDLSYGPSDEDGLTGCDQMYVPFFYKEGDSHATLVRYDTKKFDNDGDLDWKSQKFDDGLLLLVAASEGGSDEVADLAPGKDGIFAKMYLMFYYQDGAAKADLEISRTSKGLEVTAYTRGETSY